MFENQGKSFEKLPEDNSETLSLTFCGTDEFPLHEVGNSSLLIPTEIEDSLSFFSPQYSLRYSGHKVKSLGRRKYSMSRKVTYKIKEWKVKKRRRKKKQKIKKNKIPKSQQPVSTNFKDSKSKNYKEKENAINDFCPFKETFSQESVSLLKECYEERLSEIDFPNLTETCINSQLELINVNAPNENEGECDLTPDLELNENFSQKTINFFFKKANSFSQTDFSIYQYEKQSAEQVKNEANFIKSIVSLKYILSHGELTNENFFDTLNILKTKTAISTENNSEACFSESSYSPLIFREASKCSISNSYEFFFQSISFLLNHLEISLQDNLEELACLWKGSLYELEVDILTDPRLSDLRVQKSVDLFLRKIIDSIHTNEKSCKNLALESKATFVIVFCQSHVYSYNVINYIVEQIKALKDNEQYDNSSLKEKLVIARKGKNYYFLLRILQSLLESAKKKYEQQEMKIVETVKKKNFDILAAWKKHWKQHDRMPEPKSSCHLTSIESKWCEELDEVLIYCLEHLPVLGMALERCGRLAKDIFRLSHWKNGGNKD